MNNKLLIIGDSHCGSLKRALFRAADPNAGGFRDKLQFDDIEQEGRSAYTLDYSSITLTDLNNVIILSVFGECDIRKYLPKYNNAQEVVDMYVSKTKQAFPKNRIIFIEPMPQVINLKASIGTIHTFEKRFEQQNKFYKALSAHDIEIIRMIDSIGIDRLTDSDTFDQQHLSDEHADNLVNYIYSLID